MGTGAAAAAMTVAADRAMFECKMQFIRRATVFKAIEFTHEATFLALATMNGVHTSEKRHQGIKFCPGEHI